MQLQTIEECRTYVESELIDLIDSRPDWHYGRSVDVPVQPLTWRLGRGAGGGWYTLQARLGDEEFLVWFGNHHVGAEQVNWIVRPAVHVSFEDLKPRTDPVGIRCGLADVLRHMIDSLNAPAQFNSRFELNSFSLT